MLKIKTFTITLDGDVISTGKPLLTTVRKLRQIQNETGYYLQRTYMQLCCELQALPVSYETFVQFGARFSALVTCDGETEIPNT